MHPATGPARSSAAGIGVVSSSVEVADPARRLCRRLGFEDEAHDDHAPTMVPGLRRDGPRGR
ncbi:MAG: hypothetical protein AB1Z55_04850 [Acidimicrobiia bacterium]